MKICSKTKPCDLIQIFKTLKKIKINFLDKNVPLALLRIIYGFLWDIMYEAKILSKHAKKKVIELKEINSVCLSKVKKFRDEKKHLEKCCFIGRVVNLEPLPKQNLESFGKKMHFFSTSFPLVDMTIKQT